MSCPKAAEVDWRIELQGRAWQGDEAMMRHEMTIEMKLEMSRGKLLWSEDERVLLAGLLIENVGAEAIVRLGDPAIWKAAIARLEQ